MFDGVINKLERVEYFLNNIKALAKEAGGFPYIKKRQEIRANLDAFFFELISAKDFFLQAINDGYKLKLEKKNTTKITELKKCLKYKNELKALAVVESIGNELGKRDSWLWKVNNYRNSATHRELLHFGHEVKIKIVTHDKDLFDKMHQRGTIIKPIFEGQEKEIPPEVPRFEIPAQSVKTYLFRDPEDPKQGNADMEVIPYCEQSLKRMHEFLEKSHSELDL
jgi:hypothetical protein